LLVNFGEYQEVRPASEPLLAPPSGCTWESFWTSESPRYGGAGTEVTATREQWLLPRESAVALRGIVENIEALTPTNQGMTKAKKNATEL
jgi:maltooligosyltrehalose trehalohydrolase